jgi:hypothetical protein
VRGNVQARFCSRGVRGDPYIDCNRLSAAIARRAQELIKAKLADTNGPVTPAQPPAEHPQGEATPALPLPEAPVSIVRRIGDGEECYQCNQECWDFLYTPTLSLPAMA